MGTYSLGALLSKQNGDITAGLKVGDNLFAALWRRYPVTPGNENDGALFDEYFRTSAHPSSTATTTPHNDFRVFNWIFDN